MASVPPASSTFTYAHLHTLSAILRCCTTLYTLIARSCATLCTALVSFYNPLQRPSTALYVVVPTRIDEPLQPHHRSPGSNWMPVPTALSISCNAPQSFTPLHTLRKSSPIFCEPMVQANIKGRLPVEGASPARRRCNSYTPSRTQTPTPTAIPWCAGIGPTGAMRQEGRHGGSASPNLRVNTGRDIHRGDTALYSPPGE